MDEERRLKRAVTFDEIAELYDRARRGYPEAWFDDLFAVSKLDPKRARVLEVGCGTGQATRSLATRGASVQCVEMGENLARLARRNLAEFPRVSVDVARFEDWDSKGALFDMVFAATSWHWIDPVTRYARAASLLVPGGVLAFTVGAHVYPPDVDPFFLQVHESYKAIGEAHPPGWTPPLPDDIPDSHEEVEESGFFRDVRVLRYVDVQSYDAEEHVALMSTASDHRLMAPEKRERLFADMRRLIAARPGGRVTKHQLVMLHVAFKR